MKFLDDLAARRRFGMKPGLDTIRGVCAALGNPQRRLRNVIHVAGTNGKGAVCAILDAALSHMGTDPIQKGTVPVARYTSPHLVRLNERFFLKGAPIPDGPLDRAAAHVAAVANDKNCQDLTFFEALTAVAFEVFAEADPDYTILETGLGGRLDATNICEPTLTIITKVGLDHCDWLGDTVEKIAAEKAGIIKPGVPIVLARNQESVRAVIEARAREVGSPFYYAPDLASEEEIPSDFSLNGRFNRENAVTALAALKVLLFIGGQTPSGWGQTPSDRGQTPSDRGQTPKEVLKYELNSDFLAGFGRVVWPGRFQRIGKVIVDGAHNPPAARALVEALRAEGTDPKYDLIAGFCGDKDIEEVLKILAPVVRRAWAVKTCNPRSLAPEEVAEKMRKVGIAAESCDSLQLALRQTGTDPVLICGSLFLAGEAVVLLGGYPWGEASVIDPSELLCVSS